MKLVLLNPPNFESFYINRDLMGGLGVNNLVKEKPVERLLSFLKARSIRLPMMSLAYSAAVLSKKFDVAVVDAANLDLTEEDTFRRIEALSPDMLISTTSISMLMKEAAFVSRVKRESGAIVGLTGDAATHLATRVMDEHPIDFVIKGDEPEGTLSQLAQSGDYRQLPGIAYRDGEIIADTGDPSRIVDLDALPFPKWDLFPVKVYRYFPILRRTPFLTVLSTRGCPYGCIYCPYTSNQGLKYRYRRAENVIAELVLLKEKHGIRAVQFRDPTFTIRKERTLAICDGIVANKLDIEWGCETRADRLTEELVDRMVAAGLRGVNIGIESASPDVIKNVHRGWIDLDHIRKMVQYMTDRGVRVSGFFVIGLPGETRSSIEKTLELARELPLSYAEFKVATPFPGTPLFEMAKQNKWIENIDIEQFTSYTPAMRISDELDPDYLKLTASRAYRSFYTKPRRAMKELSSMSFLVGLISVTMR
jgi:radical SAM superfamily enzyme YgiQ (UPF0313 family)